MPLSISEQNIPSTAHCHNETLELANFSDAPQLSFAGCGFLCIYHAGVGAAIKEYAPHLASNRIKGSSAGAIAAAGLICDVCISQATSTILQVVTEARAGSLQALSPNFNIIGLLRTGLEQSLPPNAHILCTGRLFISATRARDYKNVIISEFDSREELIQAIICSCFIPFYCGLSAPCYRGEQYIDGGFSDNQPGKFDHGTITVSPFSGESDICPSDDDSASMFGFDFYGTPIQFTTQNLFRMVVTLFPPSPEICSRICRQGFEDTLRFLTKNCMAPCVKCLTVQSNAIPVTQQQKEEEEEKPIRSRAIRGNKWQTEEEKRWRKTASVSRMSNLRNECNRCFEHVDRAGPPRFSSVPLPNTILKSLSEMEERNCTWMNYLRRQRLFRWWYRLLIPVILPCEMVQFGVNKIRNWLSSVASTEQCLARLQSVVDFFLAQIESRQLLHSPSPHFPAGVLSVGPISSFKIASSDALASVPVPPVAFAESMGTTARKISSAVLMEQRKASVAPLDLAMPWQSLAEAKEREEEKEEGEEKEEEEEKEEKKEALQQLDQYCSRHDAILTFHYMDDTTNQLKMCQIFDAEGRNPRKDSEIHAPISTTYFASDSAEFASPAEHKEGGEDDSGLSLTEEEEKMPEQSNRKASSSSAIPTFLAKSSSSVRRKDASAVRPFASVHPPRSFPQKLAISATAKPPLSVLRRHTFASQKASSFTANSRIPFAVATPKNGTTEEEKWPKGGERGAQNRTAEMTARRGGIPQLIRRRTTTRLPSNKAGALQGRQGFSTDSEGGVDERDTDEKQR